MSPLSIKPFRNLWLGQAISQMGDSFYYVIFAFMVQRVTGSSAMVGFTSAVETLPYLLFSAYAGVMADRMDRRKIMLLSDLLSAGLLILFACVVFRSANPPVWALMTTAGLLSTVRAFFIPAKSAAIPALVPEDMLLKANSLSAATQSFMPLISLTLSALVLSALYAISARWFFLTAVLLNTLSFVGSAIFVAKLPAILPDRDELHEKHPMQDMRDGLAYVRGRHELWMLLAMQLVLNLMISPFFVVYLAANKRWFGDLPSNLAWFEAAFFAGMVISSFLVGRMTIKRVGLSYIVGVAGVGVCVAVMGFTPDFRLFLLWNLLAGLLMPFGSIPVNTYMQMTVPDGYRGRVNSAWATAGIGVQPIGMALGGLLVEGVGLVGGFITMGAGMCAASTIGLLDRRFRAMTLPETDAAGAEPVPA